MSAPDWKQGEPPEEKGKRSRVFRQTVEIEIVWLAESEDDNGFRDWEAEVRGAVMSAEPPAHPGRGWVSDVEELAAERACPAAHDSEEDFTVSTQAQESYPPDWWHATIHLHPSTGEMHSDGDHRVRQWLEARLGRLPRRLGVSTQNKRGEWVPAVPMPLLGVRKHCQCGRKFWTLEGYQGHYAYAHVLGMEKP